MHLIGDDHAGLIIIVMTDFHVRLAFSNSKTFSSYLKVSAKSNEVRRYTAPSWTHLTTVAPSSYLEANDFKHPRRSKKRMLNLSRERSEGKRWQWSALPVFPAKAFL